MVPDSILMCYLNRYVVSQKRVLFITLISHFTSIALYHLIKLLLTFCVVWNAPCNKERLCISYLSYLRTSSSDFG